MVGTSAGANWLGGADVMSNEDRGSERMRRAIWTA
jgi:hypothetical protein